MPVRQRVLRLFADRQYFALECVLIRCRSAPRDDRLPDDRHLLQDGLAKTGNIYRDLTPSDQTLALDPDEMLETADRQIASLLVAWHETHRDGIVAWLRQFDLSLRRPAPKEGIGNLD